MLKYFDTTTKQFCQVGTPFEHDGEKHAVYQPYHRHVYMDQASIVTPNWSLPDCPRIEKCDAIAEKITKGELVLMNEVPNGFPAPGIPTPAEGPQFGNIYVEPGLPTGSAYLFISDQQDVFQVARIERILLPNVAEVRCFDPKGESTAAHLMVYQEGRGRYFLGAESYHSPLLLGTAATSLGAVLTTPYAPALVTALRKLRDTEKTVVGEFGLYRLVGSKVFFAIDPNGYAWVATPAGRWIMTVPALLFAINDVDFDFRKWTRVFGFTVMRPVSGRFAIDDSVLQGRFIFVDMANKTSLQEWCDVPRE